MKTPWEVAEDERYKKLRSVTQVVPWMWYRDVYDALQEVLKMLNALESMEALRAQWDSTHGVKPEKTGDYKRAKGVVPWRPGDIVTDEMHIKDAADDPARDSLTVPAPAKDAKGGG